MLLDSKAGLITGNIGFTNLSAQFNHSISPDHPPIHEIGLMCEVKSVYYHLFFPLTELDQGCLLYDNELQLVVAGI